MARMQASQPTVLIQPSSGWRAVDVAELWAYRDLFVTLAARDLKVRYKQTVLGVLWVVVQPLVASLIFAVVFGRVARLPSDGLPYVAFAYAGLLAWGAFSGTVTRASVSLSNNVHLVSKVYFPRLILPLAATVSVVVDFAVASMVMGILLAIFGIDFRGALLLLPVWLALVLLLGWGVGLSAAALTVRFRDVSHILPVSLQLLLYASPIAYSVGLVPPSLRPLYSLNPLTGALELFRWSILGTVRPQISQVAWTVVFAIATFAGGTVLFKRAERNLVDVL